MTITKALRPDLDQNLASAPLVVTGPFPDGEANVAYETRLQVHNNIGPCSLEVVSASNLPPAAKVYIENRDDGSAEVVISWPAYSASAAPITNPNFAIGMEGWKLGAGWGYDSGSDRARYLGVQGSSILSSQDRYPVRPGIMIHAECEIEQGASSAGNAGGGVRLEWRDETGQVRAFEDGGMVMSASGGAVYPSLLDAWPPPEATTDWTVNIACHGIRKRQNLAVWADDFTWDHETEIGLRTSATICLDLLVRDSGGRSAPWAACAGFIDTSLRDLWIGFTAAGEFYTGASDTGFSDANKRALGGAGPVTSNASFGSDGGMFVTRCSGSQPLRFDVSRDGGMTWVDAVGSGNYLVGCGTTSTHGVVGCANSQIISVDLATGAASTQAFGVRCLAVKGGIVWATNGSAFMISTDGGATFAGAGGSVYNYYWCAATDQNFLRYRVSGLVMEYSPDGVSWTGIAPGSRPTPYSSDYYFAGFAHHGSRALILRGDGQVWVSENHGQTFSHAFTIAASFPEGNGVQRLVRGGDAFYALSSTGGLYRVNDAADGATLVHTYADAPPGRIIAVQRPA